MTADDLLTRARAGDGDAFRDLTEPHLRELRVHCYRMLGSMQDAEDALQDTLLAAWQGLHGFEGRSSVRTWLYRVATNRCLNVRRSAARRKAEEWRIPGVTPPEPTSLGEVAWLEPFPDALLDASVAPPGPESHYEQKEAISIAFITALQLLPPRQVAVLILRDVLGFHADEVADMLETTVDSVNGALKRARSSLRRAVPSAADITPPIAGSRSEADTVARFVAAYEAGDVRAVIRLLTADVFMSMPPMALEYRGREIVGEFCALLFASGRAIRLVPTRANGQPAFGIYTRTADGSAVGTGLMVIELAGDRVAAMNRFESRMLSLFGLPPALD
ncbi:sigma-70 family RNA polymerase sigma factor [Planctomonas sp. JC2975]|nr:sigma-70 family RNA polymerase sigma factor [Planctomonas sp. JC2975]